MSKRKYVKKEKVDETEPIDKLKFDKMLKAATFIKPPKDETVKSPVANKKVTE